MHPHHLLAPSLCVCLLLAATQVKAVYKCSDAAGKVSYQELPCPSAAGEAKLKIPAAALSDKQSNPIDAGKAICRSRLQHWIGFKDPESVRIGTIFGGSLRPTEYEDIKIAARHFYVPVNAKNSYGGYIGEKDYLCITSETGQRILRIEAP